MPAELATGLVGTGLLGIAPGDVLWGIYDIISQSTYLTYGLVLIVVAFSISMLSGILDLAFYILVLAAIGFIIFGLISFFNEATASLLLALAIPKTKHHRFH